MNDYTPNTDEVRETYVIALMRAHYLFTAGLDLDDQLAEAGEAFDRWLDQVRADAWDEALDEVSASYVIPVPDNPYRKDTRS